MKTLSIALALAAAVVGSASVTAQGATGYYVAVPVTAPAQATLVTRTAAWRLSGGAFVAAQAPERPLVLCQLVAARAGPLASFSVGGKPFDADALAKCNAKAPRADAVAAR